MLKKTYRISDKLVSAVSRVAKEKNRTETAVVEDALKFYCDYIYMKEQATVIPQEIIKVFQASIALMEQRLNNRTNQVLSSLAIETCVVEQLLANSLDVSAGDVQRYRKKAVDFIKINNRVFRLEELVE